MSERYCQGSAVNMRRVMDGPAVIFECFRCSLFSRAKGVCSETGEAIKYSIGGPVGVLCTLPDAPCDDLADEEGAT